jgi:hypothetical protein
LPPELYEQIILCIDSPKDLLNVALASKAMCTIIVPHHIQLRNIHCEQTHQPLWSALVETPIFASYITTLTLQNGSVQYLWKDGANLSRPNAPTFLDLAPRAWNAPDPPSELATALVQMVNLHTFIWWTAIGSNPMAMTSALSALTELRALRSFNFGWCAYSTPTDLTSILSPVWILSCQLSSCFTHRRSIFADNSAS